MAIPWHLALRAIPWASILANAPSIVRSADALLAETKARRSSPAGAELQELAERFAAIERRDRETAELLTQVTAQLAALTTATEVLEARMRWLLAVAIGASVLALIAIGMPLLQ